MTFDATPPTDGERVVMGFDGLATLASAWLNGELLLESSNMFLAHQCDVGGRLRNGANELLIRFASLEADLAKRRKRPRWRTPMVAHQQLRWFRTTLLGRTPGWSPPDPVVGPWKDVWLERRSGIEVAQVRLDARLEGSAGLLRCRVAIEEGCDPPDALGVRLSGQGQALEQRLVRTSDGAFEGELRVPHVERWWPHTHGEPALYQPELVVGDGTLPLDPIGFRTVEIDTSNGDFRLVVNGTPVFCRGAVWTPPDASTLRSSPGDCRAAVQQACVAGLNMLRVPGTGVYEEDHFYRTCDELGVLVWQDFMFANMDYPLDDEAFLQGAVGEATQQLQRLHAHPSLAVLCGNSEVAQQAAMWGAPRELWTPAFFEHTLAGLCGQHAPGTPYWPSSAHGGALPFQADAGTTSYYGVGAYLRPLEDARRADLKFATECLAFANVPEPSTIERMPGGDALRVHHPEWKARTPRDLGAGWDFEDVRDHYLQLLFGVEPRTLRAADHDRYLALSRAVTGEVMAAAFSEWRRPASRCGGALVLFLRDLWAGAGWGLVDDAGVPKACWHALRRVLQPVAVLLTDEGGNGLAGHVINETQKDLSARLELHAWRGGEVEVAKGARDIVLPARSAQTFALQELLEHFTDLSYAYRFGPPPCDVVSLALRGADGTLLGEAFHFPAGRQAMLGFDAGLEASATMMDGAGVELSLKAHRFAFGVTIGMPGFQPRDEHFHLPPGREVRVRLDARGGTEPFGTVQALNSLQCRVVQRHPGVALAAVGGAQVAQAGE